jgi:hypothetical protein
MIAVVILFLVDCIGRLVVFQERSMSSGYFTYDQLVLFMWVTGLWFSAVTTCIGMCISIYGKRRDRRREQEQIEKFANRFRWEPSRVGQTEQPYYTESDIEAF